MLKPLSRVVVSWPTKPFDVSHPFTYPVLTSVIVAVTLPPQLVDGSELTGRSVEVFSGFTDLSGGLDSAQLIEVISYPE
jgi:hypothetical protein